MDRDSYADPVVKHGGSFFLRRARLAVAWPMVMVLMIGVLALWASTLHSLVVTGGFAGVAAWQTLGVILLSYQGAKTFTRAKELRGEHNTMLCGMRRRLWTIFTIVAASIVANIVAIFLIVKNLRNGHLVWTIYDTGSYVVVGITLIVLLFIKRGQILKSQASLFFIVASTRMSPQVLLAFSPDLRSIPWMVLLGMLLITGQRVIVSSIEFFEAKVSAVSTKSLANAWWILLSDVGNMLAITTPIILKLCT